MTVCLVWVCQTIKCLLLNLISAICSLSPFPSAYDTTMIYQWLIATLWQLPCYALEFQQSSIDMDSLRESWSVCSVIIMGIGLANERRCYIVTPPLIGWAHTQNDHWCHRSVSLVLSLELQSRANQHSNDALATVLFNFSHNIMNPFTRPGVVKMVNISQTTYSTALLWTNIFECRLKFHWYRFPRDLLSKSLR